MESCLPLDANLPDLHTVFELLVSLVKRGYLLGMLTKEDFLEAAHAVHEGT